MVTAYRPDRHPQPQLPRSGPERSDFVHWTKEEDDAIMVKLGGVIEKVARQGKLGPVVRLLPTTTATTLRKDREPGIVIDGPFAETKEQLLGFYVINANSLDEVLDIAKKLGRANPGGAYEIRPIGLYMPEPVAK
jgi:hypothetical protein